MSKKRKTRDQKIQSEKRMEKSATFKVNPEWIKKSDKSIISSPIISNNELSFFKSDLTKTFLLSMLVLAVELALWQYLSRR